MLPPLPSLSLARQAGEIPRSSRPRPELSAFSLVELLVVMGIIALLIGLLAPAVTQLSSASDVTRNTYDIAGTLEQARAYAMANRTYVWIGFFEEDGSKPSTKPTATPGIGRVVLCVVASKNGTRYRDAKVDKDFPKAFGAADPTTPPSNPVTLVQLNKLMKLDNTHLAPANVGRGNASAVNNPDRPFVDVDYQVGDPLDSPNSGPFSMHYYTDYSGGGGGVQAATKNPTTFGYPVGTTTAAQYTFTKIIEFNPQGEASKIVDGITSGNPAWMEIALVPAHGNAVDPRYSGAGNSTKSAAAVQIGGLNGRVRIFRP